jgi:hypothetical protein
VRRGRGKRKREVVAGYFRRENMKEEGSAVCVCKIEVHII